LQQCNNKENAVRHAQSGSSLILTNPFIRYGKEKEGSKEEEGQEGEAPQLKARKTPSAGWRTGFFFAGLFSSGQSHRKAF